MKPIQSADFVSMRRKKLGAQLPNIQHSIMAKLLRVILKSLGILAALILVLAVFVYFSSNRHLAQTFAIQPTEFTLPSSPEALARGRHLAETRGCTGCHGEDLGGAKVIDDPAMGRMYGPNITRGQGGVTASYQNTDWIRAIQHGVKPNGHPLILMPAEDFTHLTQDDLGALLLYVKSAAPIDRETVPIKVGPVARGLMTFGKLKLAAEKINHAGVHFENVTPAVSVEYGRYVSVSCIGCHNPSFSGGKIAIGPPDWPRAANLTPDNSSRLKRWSETDFVTAIRTGTRPDGATINPIMPRSFGQMDDIELKALFAFLRQVPAKETGKL